MDNWIIDNDAKRSPGYSRALQFHERVARMPQRVPFHRIPTILPSARLASSPETLYNGGT